MQCHAGYAIDVPLCISCTEHRNTEGWCVGCQGLLFGGGAKVVFDNRTQDWLVGRREESDKRRQENQKKFKWSSRDK